MDRIDRRIRRPPRTLLANLTRSFRKSKIFPRCPDAALVGELLMIRQ